MCDLESFLLFIIAYNLARSFPLTLQIPIEMFDRNE